MTDALIIGAGPAGLTAAIYMLRAGLSATVFDKGFYGGQAAITPEIENYPAISSITGPEFSMQLYDQAVGLGAEVRFEEVKKLTLDGKIKYVYTDKETYQGKTLILANGVKRRKLGCPGEEELAGKGVSYCSTCAGAFFKGKDVVLVGGGNTALEDALFLSNHCRHVTLVHRRNTFRGEKPLASAVAARDNIEIRFRCAVERIEGGGHVERVVLQWLDTGDMETIEAAGIFIAIGYEPDNHLVQGRLPLSSEGYILADESCRTAVDGVYVAGDSRTKLLRQIITAAADGAVAAYQAAGYISAAMT